MADCRGQSILELLLVVPIFAGMMTGGAILFKNEWDRFRCAYRVFETTRQALASEATALHWINPRQVVVTDEGSSIEGHAQCGNATESVRLPKLENARWN